MNKSIKNENLEKYNQDLHATKAHEVLADAVQNNGINKAAESVDVKAKLNPTFSIELKTGAVSAQKHSGRCWLFSALTNLRTDFAKKYNVKDFELSQNYLSFYDRLEKANWFYQQIINTAELPLTDRKVATLLQFPDDDGGQYPFAVSLIKKYGVVPKYAMPETYNSDNTTEFTDVLTNKLHKDAVELRALASKNPENPEIAKFVKKSLSEVYRICVYAFGQPPVKFDLQLRDDDKKLISEPGLTPQEFLKKYFDYNFDDYFDALNAPQASKDFGKSYQLQGDGNMVGGEAEKFFNLPISRLKQMAIQQLKDGETVWFGNDVLQQMNRQKGLLDSKLYDYDQLFDVDFDLDKGKRLDYRQGEVSHAMVLTGVDLDKDGKPTKWKVENSWGDKIGTKGYFVMSDQWFTDYVYEVVVKKEYLTETEKKQYAKDPIILPGWDAIA